jgi:ribosomal protein S19
MDYAAVHSAMAHAEIEITPEMIEAGLVHLLRFHRERGHDEEIIRQIYRAMIIARDLS